MDVTLIMGRESLSVAPPTSSLCIPLKSSHLFQSTIICAYLLISFQRPKSLVLEVNLTLSYYPSAPLILSLRLQSPDFLPKFVLQVGKGPANRLASCLVLGQGERGMLWKAARELSKPRCGYCLVTPSTRTQSWRGNPDQFAFGASLARPVWKAFEGDEQMGGKGRQRFADIATLLRYHGELCHSQPSRALTVSWHLYSLSDVSHIPGLQGNCHSHRLIMNLEEWGVLLKITHQQGTETLSEPYLTASNLSCLPGWCLFKLHI